MKQIPLLGMILAYADKLKYKNLFLITLVLFVLDFIVPDMIPMVDELILGLLALVLANWKKQRTLDKPGEIIEGEIIKEGEEK